MPESATDTASIEASMTTVGPAMDIVTKDSTLEATVDPINVTTKELTMEPATNVMVERAMNITVEGSTTVVPAEATPTDRAMNITVKGSTTVVPAEATPADRLWLSNLDVAFPSIIYARVVKYYRYNGVSINFFDSEVLKLALSRALVRFYPVAGCLKRDDNGRIEIDCTGDGVLFVEAEADGVLDDLGDFSPNPKLQFIRAVNYSDGISANPLFIAQLTRFRCGGVALGTAYEHHLSDGPAAFDFINTWAKLARDGNGDAFATTAPVFMDQRAVLAARNPPQPQFDHVEYQPPPKLNNSNAAVASETFFKWFRVSKDQIEALKAKCKPNEEGTCCTTFVALSAHAWRCLCKARKLPSGQETKLRIAVDGRSRIQPPPPPTYYGNFLFFATPVATSDFGWGLPHFVAPACGPGIGTPPSGTSLILRTGATNDDLIFATTLTENEASLFEELFYNYDW